MADWLVISKDAVVSVNDIIYMNVDSSRGVAWIKYKFNSADGIRIPSGVSAPELIRAIELAKNYKESSTYTLKEALNQMGYTVGPRL